VDWVQHKNPYDQWNNITHYAFACELASLIGEVALPAGGASNAKRVSELMPEDNPWKKSVEAFYRNVIVQLNKHWPNFKGRVMFIHHECGDKTIKNTIDEVHSSQTDPRIGQLTFAKKINNPDGTKSDDPVLCFQLQAADLFAGLMKQQAQRVWESDDFSKPEPRTLDFLISGKSEYCVGIDLLRWRFFTKSLIEDEKIKKSMWEKAGIKQKYYPLIHFDFEKYGFKITRENAV
jgi:hypothetical protein